MGFVVAITARGLPGVNWVGERGGLGLPRLQQRRENAKIFPTREEADRMASEMVDLLDDSARTLVSET
jgi:hypothetical protein